MLVNEKTITAFIKKANADIEFDECIAEALAAGYSNGKFNVNEDLAYVGFKSITIRTTDKVSGKVWVNCTAEVSGILSTLICKVYELRDGRFVFMHFKHKED